MAKIKKLCNNSFILEKPVIIYSKGIFDKSLIVDIIPNAYICSLNTGAIPYTEKIDFLFFNDIETIENIKKQKFDINKIVNMICPINPHTKSGREQSNFTYKDVYKLILETTIDMYTYRLHTQQEHIIENPLLHDTYMFGRINSVYHTALYWLLLAGFKKFYICGVSTTGEYNSPFVKQNDCGTKRSTAWYTKNYNRGLEIFEKARYFSIAPIEYVFIN